MPYPRSALVSLDKLIKLIWTLTPIVSIRWSASMRSGPRRGDLFCALTFAHSLGLTPPATSVSLPASKAPTPETRHALPPLGPGQSGRHALVPRDLPLRAPGVPVWRGSGHRAQS